jgi:hypothetical protein
MMDRRLAADGLFRQKRRWGIPLPQHPGYGVIVAHLGCVLKNPKTLRRGFTQHLYR